MEAFPYTAGQTAAIEAPLNARLFLSGPAGCGRTTCGTARLRRLLDQGVCGSQILVLAPQRSLARPYVEEANRAGSPDGSPPDALTFGGLARRMVQLFWASAAGSCGFLHPHRPPRFLTLETAGYYMAQLVSPLLEKGAFQSLVIDPNRLYSQILDNLNKAAVVGFPHTEIGKRLESAWNGQPGQKQVYREAQQCASLFRAYCLENNLLDYSLQVEIFSRRLWPDPLVRSYLTSRYRHLIYDNLEEDVPLAHDLACEWLPDLDSALFIYDLDAGYRIFLGADPQGARRLEEACSIRFTLQDSFINTMDLAALARAAARLSGKSAGLPPGEEDQPGGGLACLAVRHSRYYPQMLGDTVDQVARLVNEEGVAPHEIVILSPYVSDSLRFSLEYLLEKRGISLRTRRPSHGLRDEPAVRCLLTLAVAAHPGWNLTLTRDELATCLIQALDGLDLVRAGLLVGQVPRLTARLGEITSIKPEIQERITSKFCIDYEHLRTWLAEYQSGPAVELDIFFSRLFGEVLSQPGYGFHSSLDAGGAAARLIESMRQFRWAACQECSPLELGREFVKTVRQGIISAQFFEAHPDASSGGILLSPAFGFLMENQPAAYQFWLDCGSLGWWERLDQPLTHPYVLSRTWPPGRLWTDADEYAANQETVYRLVQGLIRRCSRQVTICYSDLGEQGYDQQGPLLRLVQNILRSQPGRVWQEARLV